jgi:hypothetical protein
MRKLFASWQEYWRSLTPGLKLLVLFVLSSAVLIYLGFQIKSDVQLGPCSPGGYPARCYRITENMCDVIWTKADPTCKEIIRKLALPPGRLVGPFIAKCQTALLDKAFLYSRKSSSECDALFSDIEDWRRRNGSLFQ